MKGFTRRAADVFIVMFIVTFLTFILIDLLPGDPAVALLGETATPDQIEVVREELGLDDNVVVRYVTWIGDVVTGDLGRSFRTNQPVWDGLKQRIPVSLELMFLAQLFSLVIAVPLGIYSAYRPGRTVDRASTHRRLRHDRHAQLRAGAAADPAVRRASSAGCRHRGTSASPMTRGATCRR